MNYIVFDLEWNQAKSNLKKNNNKNSEVYKNMPFEIVEIGAVKLDENFKTIGTFNRLIKPTFYKKMNPVITKITGIQDVNLKHQKDFPAVVKDFFNWCGEDYMMCTFGNQDIYELGINIHYHGMEIPWKYPYYYIDVQRIFGIVYGSENEQKSLEAASIYMGVSTKKAYHRAYNDALYTAEVLKKLNREQVLANLSMDYLVLPETHKMEKESDLGTHLEYVSAPYASKEEMLDDKNIYITRCPECMKKCKKKIRWFLDGSKYICIAKCENHGLMEGVLYTKHNYRGYFAVKKTMQTNQERYESISAKKVAIREKRRLKRMKDTQKENQKKVEG